MVSGRFLLLAAFGAFICGTLIAEVTIEERSNPHMVRTARYQSIVDWDGCLTSVNADGIEFLDPAVSISRGGYFFQAGTLKLDQVDQVNEGIAANSNAASIRYEFDDDTIMCTMENRTDQPMVFFFVLAGDLQAVRYADCEVEPAPIVQDTSAFTCFRGGKKLIFDNVSRVWGPWEGNHQVVQIDLQPGEPRRVRLTIAETTSEEIKQITELGRPREQPVLSILSPRTYQVIQRTKANEGEVLISGRCRRNVDVVELRIRENDANSLRSYRVAPFGDLNQFSLRVSLPAGGWYALEAEAKKGKASVAEASGTLFGIGEVFVGAGQSNSTNCGEFKTNQTSGMVSSFSGTHWQPADDPQPGVADNSQGGSFWPAFGDAMYEKYQVPIGVAATGFGGTSVDQWQPEGELYRWMMTRIHQLGPGGFRALLWHQGESDVGKPQDAYYQKLRNVIIKSRTDAGWDFPWFVAQASYLNADQSSDDAIRGAQQQLWTDGVALAGPDTDTLTGDHRDLNGTGVHFSPKGLKAHGEMWAERVAAYVDQVLASYVLLGR